MSLSKAGEDMLLALDALCDDNYCCTATNRELASMVGGLSISATARRLGTLYRWGYIDIERSFSEDGRVGPRRVCITERGSAKINDLSRRVG